MLALWVQTAWGQGYVMVAEGQLGKIGRISTVLTPALMPAPPPLLTPVWVSTTLPDGLQIDQRTGVISGTPTQSGRFLVTVKAKTSLQAESDLARGSFELTIADKPYVYPELYATAYASNVLLTGAVDPRFLATTAIFKIFSAGGGTEIAAQVPDTPASGVVAANAGSITIEGQYLGLVCGTGYEFSLSAANELGTSVNSGGRFNTIPCAPTGLAATAGDEQVSLEFTPPFGDANTIVYYDAACSSTDGGAPGSARDLRSPVVVGSLTNGKTYSCTVAAHSMSGRDGVPATSQNFIPKRVQGAFVAVPTLSEWALVFLGVLAAGFGAGQVRRRA